MTIRIDAVAHFLPFRRPFSIAHGTRLGTDVVIVKATCGEHVGFGEASLPPYLADTAETTLRVLRDPMLNSISYPYAVWDIMDQFAAKFPGNFPARAALDMALWNLQAAVSAQPLAHLLQLPEKEDNTPRFYTIGIGTANELVEKLNEGLSFGFSHFKLKLNGLNDKEIIHTYLTNSRLSFAVDVNQGWQSAENILPILKDLEQADCLLIEQPFHKDDRTQTRKLREMTKIPIIADEACQTLADLPSISQIFDGINIKLQKCGGLTAAKELHQIATSLGLKTLIGCMSESSIGCKTAEVLAPHCNWADLDGPFLTHDIPNPDSLFMS